VARQRLGRIDAPDAARWRELRNRAKASAQPRQWYRITNAASEDGDTAVIDIYDEIGYWGVTAADFVTELRAITATNVDLHINSPGGDVYDGLAIYNALIDHPATVTATVDALAASAASFIAQAADRIVMGRNAEMMIHDAWGMCVGNAGDMVEMAAMLDKVSDNIASIYSVRAGNGTTAAWRKRMAGEPWYSAQEAVDIGLADEVAKTEKRRGTAEPAAKWDLSVFAHSCRADAPAPDIPKIDDAVEPDPDAVPAPPEPQAKADPFDNFDLDGIEWPAPKAIHLALLDAADNAGLDVDTYPIREALEGDWEYSPDALRGLLLDLSEHAPAPTEVPPLPAPPPKHVDIDVLTNSLREALSS
jgi:ATP-dependent protease ClpP protease subunit